MQHRNEMETGLLHISQEPRLQETLSSLRLSSRLAQTLRLLPRSVLGEAPREETPGVAYSVSGGDGSVELHEGGLVVKESEGVPNLSFSPALSSAKKLSFVSGGGNSLPAAAFSKLVTLAAPYHRHFLFASKLPFL